MQETSTRSDVFAPLNDVGLNLHAVFNLNDLPDDVRASLSLSVASLGRYRQLILIGHMGPNFWAALQQRGMHGADPVDQFVGECVAHWMGKQCPGGAWTQVFPGTAPVGLQRLGLLAGWHHASPFWVGIDAQWGSWFAYRAVVLTDTCWPVTPRRTSPAPCDECVDKPCVTACPAGALANEPDQAWRLEACLGSRLSPNSPCMDRCLARNACPAGAAYRYTDAQTAYHYLQSMSAIRKR